MAVTHLMVSTVCQAQHSERPQTKTQPMLAGKYSPGQNSRGKAKETIDVNSIILREQECKVEDHR